jgi:O-antigen/teichoic acid export membrane protein
LARLSESPEFGPKTKATSRKETTGIIIGSLVAAGAAYVFLQVAARTLGPEDFAPVSTLWTVQFLILAVALMPLEQLVTRSGAIDARPPIRSALIVGSTSAGLSMTFAFLNQETLFNGVTAFVFLTPLAVLTTTVYALGRGVFAGEERYARYGQVTGGHSLVRLAAGAPLLMLAPQPVMGGVAIALAPLVILAWHPFRRFGGKYQANTERAAPFLVGLVVGNSLAQLILLGGPVAVGWLGGTATEISLAFVILTLFRAPVAVAAEGLARLLPPFTRMATAGQFAALRRAALWIVAVGAVCAALAAVVASWIGAPITVFLFGQDYEPEVAVAIWVAVGSVLATVGMTLNQVLTGAGRTSLIAYAWIVAAAAAVLTLSFAAGDVVHRVAVAFTVGEGAAVLGLLAAIFVATAGRPLVNRRLVS